MKIIAKDDNVKIHYTGKLSDGTVFDSSLEREPLAFTVGAGQVIPGFENGVIGMKQEESKNLTIPPTEAYGERRPDLVQEVPKDALAEGISPEPGMRLVSQDQEGRQFEVTVTDVKDEAITIDANHPLAGQELLFEVQVVGID